jgi:hypothetical protein
VREVGRCICTQMHRNQAEQEPPPPEIGGTHSSAFSAVGALPRGRSAWTRKHGEVVSLRHWFALAKRTCNSPKKERHHCAVQAAGAAAEDPGLTLDGGEALDGELLSDRPVLISVGLRAHKEILRLANWSTSSCMPPCSMHCSPWQ